LIVLINETVKHEALLKELHMTHPTENLVIYTTANRPYEPFVLPYMASCLEFNRGAYVEVGVEDADRFRGENFEAFELLYSRYGSSMDVTTADFSYGAPHSARFLNESQTQREFIYIGDIDMFIIEEIAPKHMRIMERFDLPYSNILRQGRKALSGLHFTRTDAFYPLEKMEGNIVNLDEAMLYQMVERKGHKMPPEDFRHRPSHGYHVSLNRRPMCTHGLHWGMSPNYLPQYLDFTQSDFFQSLFKLFAPAYKRTFTVMDMTLEAKYPDSYKDHDRRWLNAQVFFQS